MKMTIDLKYCVERNGRYYFQRGIPKPLRPVLDQASVKVPLKSATPAALKKEIEQLNRHYDRQWNEMKAGLDGPSVVAKARLMLNPDAWRFEDDGEDINEKIHSALFTMAADGDKVAETALRIHSAGNAPMLTECLAIWTNWRGVTNTKDAEAYTERAIRKVVAIIGDKPINEITRNDVNRFVDDELQVKGNTTASVDRNLSTLRSVFKRAATRFGLDITNPFAGVELPKLGDTKPRLAFETHEVDAIKADLWKKEKLSTVECILAIQMCTGATVSEVVGCALEDAHINGENIPYLDFTPHPWRKLKNDSSRPRRVPLVGIALEACKRLVEIALEIGSTQYLCPQYFTIEGDLKSTHAANAINKRLKKYPYGKTTHSFRHYIATELTNTGAPMDIRASITGHSTGTVLQSTYDHGDVPLELKLEWLSKVAL